MVRIHRAGEGATYTGLKPAGLDFGPAVPAVDQALEARSAAPLIKLVSDAIESGIEEQFNHTVSRKDFDENNIEAGREYVKAYVVLVHYVKRLYDSALDPADGHFPEAASAGMHNE